MYPGQVVPKIRLLPKYKSTWPDVLDEKKFKKVVNLVTDMLMDSSLWLGLKITKIFYLD